MAVDIIVCNLTRLGDLLQTQQLFDELAAANLKVGLVCLENFVAATPMLRNVDKVWPLPGARLLKNAGEAWPFAVRDALQFAAEISAGGSPRYVLNLTPSLPARLLARMLAAGGAQILGFGLDELGFGLNQGVWASFFSVAARKRINAPFNVADMLRNLALPLTSQSLGDFKLASPPAGALAWARDFCAKGPAQGNGFVGFQLGASEEKRRWPVRHFSQLGEILWKEAGLVPVLLGSRDESPLGKEYALSATHPFLNAIGQTGIQELAALLRSCRLLVTNDTGTMHLASGQGVPSLSFFLATAQPWDTGPLLDGCCCLEPALSCHPCAFGQPCPNGWECRQIITAQVAARLILGWLPSGDWQKGFSPEMSGQCRIWITGHDAHGLARVCPLPGVDPGSRGLWLNMLRSFWRQFFDEIVGTGASVQPKPDAERLPLPPFRKNPGPVLAQGADLLRSIGECGALLQKNPRAAELFLRNCERLQTVLDAEPHLATLAAFWREFRQNQGGELNIFLPAVQTFGKHVGRFAEQISE